MENVALIPQDSSAQHLQVCLARLLQTSGANAVVFLSATAAGNRKGLLIMSQQWATLC